MEMNIENIKSSTVFLVDDNKANLDVVVRYLSDFDLKVVPLLSGEELLKLVEKRLPDIILLDIMMPGGIDGYKTCRLLKEKEKLKNIPVIFMSALSDTVDKVKGFQLGAVDYITKPIDTEELLSRIHTHLSLSKLQKELSELNAQLEVKVEERTKELEESNALLQKEINERKHTAAINASRVHLVEFASVSSLDDLIEETLNEIEKFTGSLIGFYHFVEPDQETISNQNWSTRTKSTFCKGSSMESHYPISRAGVWSDCVREKKTVIHNDYASLPHKKGMPEGHGVVIRELTVPIFRNNQVVAVIGVGNKITDYTRRDIETVTQLADMVYDIVGRKRVDEELKANEIKFRSIFDNSIDAIELSTEGVYVMANKAYLDLFGYNSEEELEEMTVLDFIASEEREKIEQFVARRGHLENLPTRYITKGLRKDGSTFDMDVLVSTFTLKNDIYTLAILRDITDLIKTTKELEVNNENLESLLAIAQNKFSSIKALMDYTIYRAITISESESGFIFTYNQQCKKILLQSSSGFELLALNDVKSNIKCNAENIECCRKVIEQRKPLIQENCKLPYRYEGNLPVEFIEIKKLLLIPIIIENKIKAIIGVADKENEYTSKDIQQLTLLMDVVLKIMDKQQYEQELIKAKEKAEESDRLKSAFLASVSHEIRTPLNAIVGFSSIIVNEVNDPGIDRFSTIIEKESDLLLQMVNDIIEFAKMESMALEIIREKFDVNGLLTELYNLFIKDCPPDVKLSVDTPFESKIINSDEKRVKQIFINLISNAIKFTKKGQIVFGYDKEEDKNMTFFVKDTGIGISKEKQKAVFERFTKLDAFSKGFGLGLTIVKNLLSLLGGEITLQSEEGKGSEFRFTIPVK
jgi:PAS domain S-box-containing protein